MALNITYDEGGYDPTKPNDNIVSIEEVSDPEPQPVSADTVIASIAAMTEEQKQELRDALGL